MADALYNNSRIVAGDFVPVQYPKTASALIKAGDLLYAPSGAVSPASDLAWNSTLALTQEDFHDLFAGVAIDGSLAAETRDVTVAPECTAEFPCATLGSQLEVGQYIGAAKQSGNALERQKVVSVATANLAIGKLARRALVGDTSLLVKVSGVKTTGSGGVQTPA
jgi:hypothetical protein